MDVMRNAAAQFAVEDLNDLSGSDGLVAFLEPPRTATRGGRHVEFGVALALKKPVLLVGPRENIFHTMGWVSQVDAWGPEALDVLRGWRGDLVWLERLRGLATGEMGFERRLR